MKYHHNQALEISHLTCKQRNGRSRSLISHNLRRMFGLSYEILVRLCLWKQIPQAHICRHPADCTFGRTSRLARYFARGATYFIRIIYIFFGFAVAIFDLVPDVEAIHGLC